MWSSPRQEQQKKGSDVPKPLFRRECCQGHLASHGYRLVPSSGCGQRNGESMTIHNDHRGSKGPESSCDPCSISGLPDVSGQCLQVATPTPSAFKTPPPHRVTFEKGVGHFPFFRDWLKDSRPWLSKSKTLVGTVRHHGQLCLFFPLPFLLPPPPPPPSCNTTHSNYEVTFNR